MGSLREEYERRWVSGRDFNKSNATLRQQLDMDQDQRRAYLEWEQQTNEQNRLKTQAETQSKIFGNYADKYNSYLGQLNSFDQNAGGMLRAGTGGYYHSPDAYNSTLSELDKLKNTGEYLKYPWSLVQSADPDNTSGLPSPTEITRYVADMTGLAESQRDYYGQYKNPGHYYSRPMVPEVTQREPEGPVNPDWRQDYLKPDAKLPEDTRKSARNVKSATDVKYTNWTQPQLSDDEQKAQLARGEEYSQYASGVPDNAKPAWQVTGTAGISMYKPDAFMEREIAYKKWKDNENSPYKTPVYVDVLKSSGQWEAMPAAQRITAMKLGYQDEAKKYGKQIDGLGLRDRDGRVAEITRTLDYDQPTAEVQRALEEERSMLLSGDLEETYSDLEFRRAGAEKLAKKYETLEGWQKFDQKYQYVWNNADFVDLSGYDANKLKPGNPASQYYEYFNAGPERKRELESATTVPVFSLSGFMSPTVMESNIRLKGIDELDADEILVFNYLYNKKGPDAAMEYLDGKGTELLSRRALTRQQRMEEMTENSLELASLATLYWQMENAVTGPVQFVAGMLGADPNDPIFDRQSDVATVRSKAGQVLDQVYGNAMIPILNVPVASTLYNAGMSAGDSLIGRALGAVVGYQGLNRLMMTSRVLGSEMQNSLKDGDSIGMSVFRGLSAAIIENVTESLGDKAFYGNPRSVALYLAQNFFAEGSEEFLANLGNTMVELAAKGTESEIYHKALDAAHKRGWSRETAQSFAFNEWLREAGTDFLTGSLMGLMSSVAGAPGQQSRINQEKTNEAYSAIMADEGIKYSPKDKANLYMGELLQGDTPTTIESVLNPTEARTEGYDRAEQATTPYTQAQRQRDIALSRLGKTTQGDVGTQLANASVLDQAATWSNEQRLAALAEQEIELEIRLAFGDKLDEAQAGLDSAQEGYAQVGESLDSIDRELVDFRQRLADLKALQNAELESPEATQEIDRAESKMAEIQTMLDRSTPTEQLPGAKAETAEPVSKRAALQTQLDTAEPVEQVPGQAPETGTADDRRTRLESQGIAEGSVEQFRQELESVDPESPDALERITEIQKRMDMAGIKRAEEAQIPYHGHNISYKRENIPDIQEHRAKNPDLNDEAFDFAAEAAYSAGLTGSRTLFEVSAAIQDLAPETAKALFDAGLGAYNAQEGERRALKARLKDYMPKPGKGKLIIPKDVIQKMNPEQKKLAGDLQRFIIMAGVEGELFVSETADESGRILDEEGSFDPATGRFTFDINAGINFIGQLANKSRGAVEFALPRVMGHEFTHYLKATAPELYTVFQEAVIKELSAKNQLDDLILTELGRARKGALSIGVALEEVVARSSEMMFRDSQALVRAMGENPTLWQKFKAWVTEFVQNIKDRMKGMNPTYAGAKSLIETGDSITRYVGDLQAKWDKALEQSITDRMDAPGSHKTAPISPVSEGEGVTLSPQAMGADGAGIAGNKGINEGVSYTADNTPIKFRYKVVNIQDLITSHDDNYNINPAFPEELQPRDRERSGLKDQVAEIARTLNPARLGESAEVTGGAPVIGADMNVEVGNGRVIALRTAMAIYKDNARAYTQWLKDNAATFGLKPSDITANSVLVRERIDEPGFDRATYTQKANVPTTATGSETENAAMDADKITSDMLAAAELRGGELNMAGDSRFVTKFVNKIIPLNERNSFIDKNGNLSQRGETRIRNALFQRAYGDATMTAQLAEVTEGEVRNVIKAMTNIAPRIAQMNADVEAGRLHPIVPTLEIVQAYQAYKNLKQSGEDVVAYLKQVPMIEMDKDAAKALVAMFEANKNAPNRMTDNMNAILDAAVAMGNPDQITMPGMEGLDATKLSVVNDGIARAGGEQVRFSERDDKGVLITDKYPNLNLNEDISSLDGVPAIRLIDGSILPAVGAPTHVNFITRNNIDVADVHSGGWISKGIYEPSFTSETSPYIQRELAKRRRDAGRGYVVKEDGEQARFSERPVAPPMYSKMAQEIEAFKGDKMGAGSLINYLRGKGVKADEIRWSGIQTFLQGKKSVTKDELLEFARGNELRVEDVHFGITTIVPPKEIEQHKQNYEIVKSETQTNSLEVRHILSGRFIAAIDEGHDGKWYGIGGLNIGNPPDVFENKSDAETWLNGTIEKEIKVYLSNARRYSAPAPKFDQYKLNNGDNYREVLFTVPDLDGTFESAHWDERNVLAHARMQDFETKDGKPVLFIEEVQSDWHEQGREKGYQADLNYDAIADAYYAAEKDIENWAQNNIKGLPPGDGFWRMVHGGQAKEFQQSYPVLEGLVENYNDAAKRYEEAKAERRKIPPAPFASTWHEYVMKRVLRMAAEGDYDYVAWTTGKMQGERYSLEKTLSRVVSYKLDDNTVRIGAFGLDGGQVSLGTTSFDLTSAQRTFGKELGTSIFNGGMKANGDDTFEMRGMDLKIGAEGMKSFYDIGGKSSQNIPRFLNKYAGQWGAKVQTIQMGEHTVPAVEVTDKMRDSVIYEGQPLYSVRDSTGAPLSPQQVEFFKDSKVRDEEGRLLKVYHGTGAEFTVFDPKQAGKNYGDWGAYGKGFYFAGAEHNAWLWANKAAGPLGKAKIIPAFLDIKNPFIKTNGWWAENKHLFTDVTSQYKLDDDTIKYPGRFLFKLGDSTDVQGVLLSKGFDGIVDPETNKNGDYVVFSPSQIKSTTNLTPTADPDIRYSQRDPENSLPSARAILGGAFGEVAQTDAEKKRVAEYRKSADRYNRLENELNNLLDRRKQLYRDKAPQSEKNELRADINALRDKLDKADRVLLNLQMSKPLRDVVTREVDRAYQRQKAKSQERQKEYREQVRLKSKEQLAAWKDKHKVKEAEKASRNQLRESIKKLSKDLGEAVTNPTGKKHVPEVLRGAIGGFLTSVNEQSQRSLRGGPDTIADRAFYDRMDALVKAISNLRQIQNDAGQEIEDEYESVSGYLDITDDFVKDMAELVSQVKSIVDSGSEEYILNRMSVDQLKALDMHLKGISTAVKNMNALHDMQGYKAVDEMGRATHNFLSKMKNKLHRIGKVDRFLNWSNTEPIYALDRMGPAGKALGASFISAQDRMSKNAKKVLDFALATWSEKDSRAWGRELHTFTVDGEKVTMNTAQLMSLYLLNKRDQARGHLYGGGIRVENFKANRKVQADSGHVLLESEVNAMLKKLTAEQKKAADAIQEFMSTVGAEWGNTVTMARWGFNYFGEKNYFPIESARENMDERVDSAEGNPLYRLLNMGFTKGLAKGANNQIMLRNIFDVFSAHMSDMAQYNAFGLPLLNAIKWYNYREGTKERGTGRKRITSVRKDMRNAYGDAAPAYVYRLLTDISGARMTGPSGAESFGLAALRRYNRSVVAANVRVALLQPTAIMRAHNVIDARYLTAGALKNIPQLRKNIREMETHSGIAIWKQMGFYDINLSRSLQEMIKRDSPLLDRMTEKSMAFPQMMDRLTWAAIWGGARAQVAAQNPGMDRNSEAFFAKVQELFDEAIYRTQVVDTMLTRSEQMRETNFVSKWTSSFMSEPTKTYNIMAGQVHAFTDDLASGMSKGQAWGKHRRKIGRTVMTYALSVALTTAVEALMGAWRDDDDYKTFWEKFRGELKSNALDNLIPFNWLPIVKDFWQIAKGFLGDAFDLDLWGFDQKSILTEGTQWLSNGVSRMISFAKDPEGKMFYGAAYELLRGVSALTGHPFSSATREVVDLWNNTAGIIYPEYKIKRYPEKATPGYEKIYEAMVAQDTEAEAKFRGLVAANNKGAADIDKNINTGLNKLINADFDEGKISLEEALTRKTEWAGYTGAQNDIRDSFKLGDIDREEAERLLVKFGKDKEPKELFRLLERWENEDTAPDKDGDGTPDFAILDSFMEAVRTGKNLRQVVADYTAPDKYGYTPNYLAGQITSAFKQEYIDSPGKRSTLKGYLLNAYTLLGYDRKERSGEIDRWLMKYDSADFENAIATGVNLKAVIDEKIKYSTAKNPKGVIISQVTATFADQYKKMTPTERSKIKPRLIDAYVMLGYDRAYSSKKIDKWLTD